MTSVNLQYESMKRPAVKDINLKVDSGSRVAICGKGGSGKGTVLAGLARALLPSNQPIGIIKVGGVDTKLIGRKCTARLMQTILRRWLCCQPFHLSLLLAFDRIWTLSISTPTLKFAVHCRLLSSGTNCSWMISTKEPVRHKANCLFD